MTIREIQETDYEKLVELYKEFFPTHNIFQKDNDIIVAYLKKEQLERETFLVCEENNEIKGALILVLLGKTEDSSHTRWKFRHFSFKDETIGTQLLQHAENVVKQASPTAKIEQTIAESEPGKDFYLKNGYQQEASLENHYRVGEICFIFGKSLI